MRANVHTVLLIVFAFRSAERGAIDLDALSPEAFRQSSLQTAPAPLL